MRFGKDLNTHKVLTCSDTLLESGQEVLRKTAVFQGFYVGMLWSTFKRFVSEADGIASGSTGFDAFGSLRSESWV